MRKMEVDQLLVGELMCIPEQTIRDHVFSLLPSFSDEAEGKSQNVSRESVERWVWKLGYT